jgi:hypothetical protein
MLRSYQLQIIYASNERRADQLRIAVADQMEQWRDYRTAISYLRQIKDTNYTAYATQRIAKLEFKIKRRR